MKKIYLISIFILVFLFSGCQRSSDAKITQMKDMVGTWKSEPLALAIRIHPDGVVDVDVTANKIDQGNRWEYYFWFEQDQLKFRGFDGCGQKIGTYDMELLTSGNLVFHLVEDECVTRVNAFVGQREDPVTDIEWIRID